MLLVHNTCVHTYIVMQYAMFRTGVNVPESNVLFDFYYMYL